MSTLQGSGRARQSSVLIIPTNHKETLEKQTDNDKEEGTILKAVEELSELIAELSKYMSNDSRATRDNVVEEIADVLIVTSRLIDLFGYAGVDFWIETKLQRLKARQDLW